MIDLTSYIQSDLEVLFTRALVGKTIFAFGEDGNGKYGRHEFAMNFTINNVECVVFEEDEADNFKAILNVWLDSSYHSHALGNMETDCNALLSIRNHLKNASIDPNSIDWGEIDGNPFVISFNLNLKLLQLLYYIP